MTVMLSSVRSKTGSRMSAYRSISTMSPKRQLRIAFLTSSLDAGGAERVATTLCNGWAEREHKVLLVATYSGGGVSFYDIDEAVQVTYLADVARTMRSSIFSYMRRLFALRRLVLNFEPDVIVSFLPNVNVAAILGSRLSGIPIIVCERTDPTSHPLPVFWRYATRWLYPYADMVTVQTDAVARKAITLYPRAKLIRSIPNPLPSGVTAVTHQPAPGRKRILSLGRLTAEKQVWRIVDAFADLCCEFEDWDLEIRGDGPKKAAITEQIKKQNLEGRVFVLGRTSVPWDVMARSSAFIMASRYEGFPNALLEAMGIGLPCVTFDCPSGPREISDHGRNALLVPLNDQEALVAAMRQVMCDENLRTGLGARARNSVLQRYGLDAVLAQWNDLFAQVGVGQ
jgi:GalNAc-alpha-(1->4)-GalNAc-alpha-(1->3)-diNAcBac-PP-undecaprenol alpha-1,4-N-acetyl-D-galactosaminyltransferase